MLAERRVTRDDNLDVVTASLDELPFDLKIVEFTPAGLCPHLTGDDVLLLSLEPKQCFIPETSAFKKHATIVISEYSLRTRLEIVLCSTRNPLKTVKRVLREFYIEARLRRTVAQTDGIQCNGLPTYRPYQRISKNALQFFERVSRLRCSHRPIRSSNGQSATQSG